MNKVIMIGNLTYDPEIKATKNDKKYAHFSIAVNRYSGRDAEGGADFFRVIVWEPMAEACAKYLKKGRKVGITGKLRSRSYDAQDGSHRTVTEIIADEVEFLSTADSKPEEKTETPLPPEFDGEDLPF